MAEAYLNGKPGKWRTVGGRRIFIAEGQSLKDAMWESGKFDKLDIANRNKIASKKALKEDDAETTKMLEAVYNNEMDGRYQNMNQLYDDLAGSLGIDTEDAKKLYDDYEQSKSSKGKTSSNKKDNSSSRELKPLSSYLEENGIDRDSLSKEEYNSYLKEYRRNGEIKSLKDQKPTKLSTDRYLERGEMMDVVDKWSDKGFREQGAYGNDGYGKGVLHERFASGNLEGFGGEMDDFVLKDMDMGSVDQKVALKELNKELNKKGYEATYLKDPDKVVHQDIQIKKIKSSAKSFDMINDDNVNDLVKDYVKNGKSQDDLRKALYSNDSKVSATKSVSALQDFYIQKQDQYTAMYEKGEISYNALEAARRFDFDDSKFNIYKESMKKDGISIKGKVFTAGDRIQMEDPYTHNYFGDYTITRQATRAEKLGKMNVDMKGYIISDNKGNESLVSELRIKMKADAKPLKTINDYKQYFRELGYSDNVAALLAKEQIDARIK